MGRSLPTLERMPDGSLLWAVGEIKEKFVTHEESTATPGLSGERHDAADRTESEKHMTTETQKPQRKTAAKKLSSKTAATALSKSVSYAFELTEEQEDLSQQHLNVPGNITLGQRWEALRRLFVNRLGLAVWDQQHHAKSPEKSSGTDCWLEHAIGETVVRAYALGLIHSDIGHKAEKSSPALTIVAFKPPSVVQEKDWQGEPADRRLCDVAIEILHQRLRVALPLRHGTPIIDKVRKEVARLSNKASGEGPFEQEEVIVLEQSGS